MALDKTTLKSSIKSAFLAAQTESDPAQFDAAMDTLAASISDAVDVFVKSGTVSTTVAVTSVGGVTVGGGTSGPGTGTGTGSMT